MWLSALQFGLGFCLAICSCYMYILHNFREISKTKVKGHAPSKYTTCAMCFTVTGKLFWFCMHHSLPSNFLRGPKLLVFLHSQWALCTYIYLPEIASSCKYGLKYHHLLSEIMHHVVHGWCCTQHRTGTILIINYIYNM